MFRKQQCRSLDSNNFNKCTKRMSKYSIVFNEKMISSYIDTQKHVEGQVLSHGIQITEWQKKGNTANMKSISMLHKMTAWFHKLLEKEKSRFTWNLQIKLMKQYPQHSVKQRKLTLMIQCNSIQSCQILSDNVVILQ